MMRRILILLLLLSSCAHYETSMCRHRAVECALVYGEKLGNENVGIAIGPSRSTIWHGQVFIKQDGIKWINHIRDLCVVGHQEDFTPQIYMSTQAFIANQFPWGR
jgi:hypothetical protein